MDGKACQRVSALLLALFFASGHSFCRAIPRAAQSNKRPPKAEESTLSHEVRHQLSVLPYYSVFDSITYTLEGSKVVLSGQVLRPTLRADAETAVKSLEGVVTVENRIEVLPRSVSDDDLRTAVYRAIYEDPVLQKYGASEVPAIHIIVKEGVLALEGSVSSESDKNLASARVAHISGVTSVKNNLAVRGKAGQGS